MVIVFVCGVHGDADLHSDFSVHNKTIVLTTLEHLPEDLASAHLPGRSRGGDQDEEGVWISLIYFSKIPNWGSDSWGVSEV